MRKVTIVGWVAGFNPVALNHLLQNLCSHSLREAKEVVDKILGGEVVTIYVLDERQFCEEAEKLGAKCINNTHTE